LPRSPFSPKSRYEAFQVVPGWRIGTARFRSVERAFGI
jgi:hypothetical protein